MLLSRALGAEPKAVVAFVGGGGKTTAMFRLAEELAAQNRRVVTTTTTRLFRAQAEPYQHALLRYDAAPEFAARVGAAVQVSRHVLVVGDDVEGDKVAGVPPAFVDRLASLDAVDVVIVEADGAKLRPLKAPAEHEPVLPESTSLLVAVAGVTTVGAPLDEEHVHRATQVSRLTGAPMGSVITAETVARVLAHAEGGLKSKPATARATALINQVESDAQFDSARAIARLLLREDSIATVAIGAARAADPIRETHQRIAAIVLAAGAGTRMRGRIKQLLPWRNGTLLQNALEVVGGSSVDATVLVLGARADEIRAAIGPIATRVVVNPDWEEGHSSSIRVGLQALGPNIAAAIFLNADQPLLTSAVIDAIIQRYRETGAGIVVPLYAGKRGSPVLFDRSHFDELKSLNGEQGGREVLVKHPFESVEFANADAAFDVDTLEDYEEIKRRLAE